MTGRRPFVFICTGTENSFATQTGIGTGISAYKPVQGKAKLRIAHELMR